MTAFEVVFTLVTMITSLAIAHLLNGFASFLRNARRVRFSLPHALWSWTAFSLVIGNWASTWEMRAVTSWPAWAVLLLVTCNTVQYLFCALVTPVMPQQGELDLGEFHARSHRGYVASLIVLLLASQALNFTFGGADFYASWWRDSLMTSVALVLCVVAIASSRRWLQVGSALLMAVNATYFMVAACNVVVL